MSELPTTNAVAADVELTKNSRRLVLTKSSMLTPVKFYSVTKTLYGAEARTECSKVTDDSAINATACPTSSCPF